MKNINKIATQVKYEKIKKIEIKALKKTKTLIENTRSTLPYPTTKPKWKFSSISIETNNDNYPGNMDANDDGLTFGIHGSLKFRKGINNFDINTGINSFTKNPINQDQQN